MLRRALLEHGRSVALVAIGGALGAYARYGVELLVGHALLGTLAANVAGCFLLGLLLFDVRADELLSRRHRLVFGTGFCASFTTYSTLALDVVETLTTDPAVALAYLVGSYGLGFGAVLASRAVVATVGSSAVAPPTTGDRR